MDGPFDAALMQSIPVSDTQAALTATAYGLVETAVVHPGYGRGYLSASRHRPAGRRRPHSPEVIWSAPAAPHIFEPLTLTVQPQGETATLFLRGTLNTPQVLGTAVWDQRDTWKTGSCKMAALKPLSSTRTPSPFPKVGQPGSRTAAPACPQDGMFTTVYAAWSADGGGNWTGPAPVTGNHDASVGTTGAIGATTVPLITPQTETPSVSFVTIYESGDPPPGTTFLRFGRPVLTLCDLGSTNCTDSPGAPLLPRQVVRPSSNLRIARDPFNDGRALLAWNSLQTDLHHKDVYATYLVLR